MDVGTNGVFYDVALLLLVSPGRLLSGGGPQSSARCSGARPVLCWGGV